MILYSYIIEHYKEAPYGIEIVSNYVSSDGEVRIGNRRFNVRKLIVPITKENVRVL